jgi:hypothetical protein
LNRTGQHEIGSGNQKEIELVGHMQKQVKGPVEREPLDWNAQGSRKAKQRIALKGTTETEACQGCKVWNEVKKISV